MSSRVKDQTTPHQPLLSSLVIRPVDTGVGGASDYEPGEVRRDPHRNSRSGYRMRAGSLSPVRRRGARRSYSPGIEHSGVTRRNRGVGSGIDLGRYRDSSPPYGHWKNGGRFSGRGYDASGPFKREGLHRNNPNVQPREGDWICSDPSCKNLNFARREFCNNCNLSRYAPARSPRRGYPDPTFPSRERFTGPPNHSPLRLVSGGYRSPPHGWPRHSLGDIRDARLPPRHEDSFHDPLPPSDRLDLPENDYRDRYRHERSIPLDWNHRDHGMESQFEKRGYRLRDVSPPPLPLPLHHQRDWGNHIRERSRSPVRGEAPWGNHIRERSRSPVRGEAPSKDFHSDVYLNRRRDDRRGVIPQGF